MAKKQINKAFKIVTKGGGCKNRVLHQLYRFKQKQKHLCDVCARIKVIRLRSGIWRCTICNSTSTGGAYDKVSSRN